VYINLPHIVYFLQQVVYFFNPAYIFGATQQFTLNVKYLPVSASRISKQAKLAMVQRSENMYLMVDFEILQ
jgi:hypothetical protein